MANGDNSVNSFYEGLDALYQAGDTEGALAYILKLKDKADSAGGADGPIATELTLAVYSELGSYYKAVSRYEDAVTAHITASRLIEELLGAGSEDYAVNLCNIAGTYRLWGKFEDAEKYFFESKELFEKVGATKDYYYASVINNIGLLYQDKGEDLLAAEYIERSIEILKGLEGVRAEVATALTNISSIYRNLGRAGDAEHSIDTALEIFDSLPPHPHHAAALNARAMMYYREGEFLPAKESFEKALAKTERFFGQNVEYAIAAESLAATLGCLGQKDEQKIWLEKALAVFDRVYGADNARSGRIEAQLEGLSK
jgi:tetratricopeptide (TPR) repeat protein